MTVGILALNLIAATMPVCDLREHHYYLYWEERSNSDVLECQRVNIRWRVK